MDKQPFDWRRRCTRSADWRRESLWTNETNPLYLRLIIGKPSDWRKKSL